MPNRAKELFARNLRNLLASHNLTQVEFAEKMNLKQSTLSDWMNAKKYPRVDNMQNIANYFNILMSDLVSESPELDIFQYGNIMPLPKTKRIPLIGTIACGTSILAEENIEGYVLADVSKHTDFALRCDGDSMVNARINNGDIVYIRKQSDVNNGEIAAVLVENKATLKRIFKLGDHIELRAENPKYNPIIINKDDNIEAIILGKVISALIHFE